MSVDLSKAKPGMIAKFRCGGEAVIERMVDDNIIQFKDYSATGRGMHSRWFNKGQYDHVKDLNHPFDIVALEEPPFGWKDVKPGMAFLVRRDDEISFVGHWVGWTRDRSACIQPTGQARPEVYTTGILKRAPEHDIQVPA